MPIPEDDLRRMFHESREATGVDAPSFESTWAAVQSAKKRPQRRGATRRLAWQAAVALLVVAALVVAARHALRPVATTHTATDPLDGWTAPTDVLLRDFGLGLPDALPAIGREHERLLRDWGLEPPPPLEDDRSNGTRAPDAVRPEGQTNHELPFQGDRHA